MPGSHFVEHHAKRKNIRARIEFLAERLLRGHIGHGAAVCRACQVRIVDHRRARGRGGGFWRRGADSASRARNPESWLAAIGDENIRGLDVAMHDAFRVRRVECIRDSGAQVQSISISSAPVIERVLERAPLQRFHGDEGAAAIFADIVNRANVGMIQTEAACASR